MPACRIPRVRMSLLKLERLALATQASAILEFAITLPLLVVFVVGIYDFSGAFNYKQKIEQAAQEGAIVAAAQPWNDIENGATSPDSVLPVVTAVFNSLVASGIVQAGACAPPGLITPGSGLSWSYKIVGCSASFPGDPLLITVNRGWVSSGPPFAVGTTVTVNYPYHWRFNSAIQLLIPGATYAAVTTVQESATVHNQT